MKFHLFAVALLPTVATHAVKADGVSAVKREANHDIRKAGADREEHLSDVFSDPAPGKSTRGNLRSIKYDTRVLQVADAAGKNQGNNGGGGGTIGQVLDGSGHPIGTEACNSFNNEVDGYPCSPFPVVPFRTVFSTTVSFNPPIKESIGRVCRDDGHCAVVYEYDVIGIEIEVFGGAIDQCKGKRTKLLSYGGTVPAKTMLVPSGVEAYVQFNNKITRTMTPRATMFNYEGCRPQENGKTGVPLAIHNHGQASLAPFDGYAVDRTCLGETKAYMFPNNRPASGWFHDHAVHQTGLNVLYGMLGFYLISENKALGGCGDPYNLDGVEEIHLALGDYVIDPQCQLYWDEEGAHKDDYYGDINMVNGHPYPTLSSMKRKWYRFRSLNAAVSRPFLLKIVTPAGIDVSSSLCQVVATDGGWLEFGPIPRGVGARLVQRSGQEAYETCSHVHILPSAGEVCF
jgi:hypothetical protein